MDPIEDLGEIHVTWLEGGGASYRIKGYFVVLCGASDPINIDFEAVAFGGNYGGHNINVQISDRMRENLIRNKSSTIEDIEQLISEVQKKMLNNDMIVEYEKLRPANGTDDPSGKSEL